MKYYSTRYTDCYPLKYFQSDKQFEGEILELDRRDIGSGFFYCSEFDEVGESSTGECGRECEKYRPRNKKSGRCRFHKNTFIGTGQYFKLENNKLVRVNETKDK